MVELIKDKSFDLNNISEYSVSIQVNLDGFSFIIIDLKNQKLIAFKNEPLKISNERFLARRLVEWIESQELLKLQYEQINILFHSNNFTLIPETYYNEEKNYKIFSELFSSIENQILKVNTLPGISSKILFALPIDFNEELGKIYTNYSLIHPVELLFQNKSANNDSFGGEILLLLNSENLFILIFGDNKLLVANSYKYFHFNDILYFMLSNLQQCEIEAGNTKLYITGSITNKNQNEFETNLKKYFGSVKLLKSTLSVDQEIFDSLVQQNSLLLLK